MSAEGKPGADSPRQAARDLGLVIPSGANTWTALVDAAVGAYWDRRPEPSRAALVEYRRRRKRNITAPDVWLRRAGAA